MMVYFANVQVIKQHGEIVECMHVECRSVFFVNGKAAIIFGDNDFSTVELDNISKIE